MQLLSAVIPLKGIQMDVAHNGTNASGMRRFNERLILAAIRRMSGVSKAELARLTSLSPQAVVRIVDQLEAEGFIAQSGRRTGGMGQPATIYRINANRGCTIGVEVGRNGLRLALVNFDGGCEASQLIPVQFPDIEAVIDMIGGFIGDHVPSSVAAAGRKFLGVGIAMPWFLGEWREELGISEHQASEWRHADVEQRFRAGIDCPVYFENDGNAAALAQLLCGAGQGLQDFLTIHMGTFVGGGLVLGGQIIQGRHGNAGAIASMPILKKGKRDYLLHQASLYAMPTEKSRQAQWLSECADALAFSIIGANSLLDLEAVVLDGLLTPDVLADLKTAIQERLTHQVPPDFFPPKLVTGSLAESAVAIGAGLLPVFASYSPNLAVLAKSNIEKQPSMP